MAQPIYFRPGAALETGYRAQAAAAPYLAAADVIGTVAGGIERTLFAYQQRMQEEKETRIAASTAMGNKYGWDALGPDFVTQWEKDVGVRFPRDEFGRPRIPKDYEQEVKQKTAQAISEAITRDPKQALIKGGLMEKTPSPEETAYKTRFLELRAQSNRIREEKNAIEQAAARAKQFDDDRPSGVAYDPKTGKLVPVDPSDPRSLSNRGLNNVKKAIETNFKALDAQHTQAQIDLINNRLKGGDSLDKAVSSLLTPDKKGKIPYSKLSGFELHQANALLKSFADRYQISLPAEVEANERSWKSFWSSVTRKETIIAPTPAGEGPAVQEVVGTLEPEAADAQMKKQLSDLIKSGVSAEEILAAAKGDKRVEQALSEVTGIGQSPQLPSNWRPGQAPMTPGSEVIPGVKYLGVK